MISEIEEILKERLQTLAFAESCTGGLLAAEFVKRAGVSSYFLGGVVAYSNELKKNILGVSESLLRTVGAVSSPVALEMAYGLKSLTGATWTVSITGIAGPAGGSSEKPVGTVHIAVVGPGFEEARRNIFPGNRQQIQEASVKYAIEFLKQSIKGEK